MSESDKSDIIGDLRNEMQRQLSAQSLKDSIGALNRNEIKDEVIETNRDLFGVDFKDWKARQELQELIRWGLKVRAGANKIIMYLLLAAIGGGGTWFIGQHWK